MAYVYKPAKEIVKEEHKIDYDRLKDALSEFKSTIHGLESTILYAKNPDEIENKLFNVDKSFESLNFLIDLKKIPYNKKVRKNLNKTKRRLSIYHFLKNPLVEVPTYFFGTALAADGICYLMWGPPPSLEGPILVGALAGFFPAIILGLLAKFEDYHLITKLIEKTPYSSAENVIKYSKPFILAVKEKYKV